MHRPTPPRPAAAARRARRLLLLGLLVTVTPLRAADATDAAGVADTGAAAAVHDAPGSTGPEPRAPLPLAELRAFTEVFDRIRTAYVEPVSDAALLESAVRGMLADLDPHSEYLDEAAYALLEEETTGQFGGVGIEVGTDDGRITVIAPVDGSPAAAAGLRAGDILIEVDGEPVRGNRIDAVIDRMRGEPGSRVRIAVLRSGEPEPLRFDLERAIIESPSVRSEMLATGFGYVRISQFQVNTAGEFVEAVARLSAGADHRLGGLVIDLRNNPGGVLQASVDVSDALLDAGTIVYTEGRIASARQRYEATTGDLARDVPIVVLVNEGTASAAEIVAGALQDNRRAVILGTRTYGKGSVQTVLPLGETRGIKLTTSLYFTPAGRSIQAHGIQPDIVHLDATLVDAGATEREADLPRHLQVDAAAPAEAAPPTADDGVPGTYRGADAQIAAAVDLLRGFALLRTVRP